MRRREIINKFKEEEEAAAAVEEKSERKLHPAV